MHSARDEQTENKSCTSNQTTPHVRFVYTVPILNVHHHIYMFRQKADLIVAMGGKADLDQSATLHLAPVIPYHDACTAIPQ